MINLPLDCHSFVQFGKKFGQVVVYFKHVVFLPLAIDQARLYCTPLS